MALLAPQTLERAGQVRAEARRQRTPARRAPTAEQHDAAHGTDRYAHRVPRQRRRIAQHGERTSRTQRGGQGCATRRTELEQATGRAGQCHDAPQRLGERVLDRFGAGQWGEHSLRGGARHGGVRTRPGRLPVCSPCLMTKRPFTITCSMPSG